MHNEMLQVEGKKMSKSLGNFFTVRDLLDKGVPGEVIRFVFLSTHYSKPMDWTEEKAKAAEVSLRKWSTFARSIPPTRPDRAFLDAISDDLNTSLAITELHRIYSERDAGRLRASAQMLGLMADVHEKWLDEPDFEDVRGEIVDLVSPLLSALNEARRAKAYELADGIRDDLRKIGVQPQMKDGKFEWQFNWRGLADARDRDLPKLGFLGPAVHIADSARQDLLLLQKKYLNGGS
jgi:cysteinyl-tRNA synthetase